MSRGRTADPSRGATSSRLRRLLGVVVVVAVFLALSVGLFVVPRSDDGPTIRAAGPVDAIVVLGGAPQQRYDAAVSLASTLPEPPPTMVLAVQYEAPVLACGTAPELPRTELRCFSPRPATTAGEAAWIGQQAAAEGWQRVVVVTSAYHVTRTRMLTDRCMGVVSPGTDLRIFAADDDETSLRGVWSIMTEWPSLLGTPWDHQPACR